MAADNAGGLGEMTTTSSGSSALISDTLATVETALPVVDTDNGPVTLASLEYLEQLCSAMKQQAQQLSEQIGTAQTKANEFRAMGGRLLTSRKERWPSDDRRAQFEAAAALEQLAHRLELEIAETSGKSHHGLGGLVQSIKDKREVDSLRSELRSAQAELNNRYPALAEHVVVPTGDSELDAVLAQSQDTLGRVHEFGNALQSVLGGVQRLTEELKRRKEVQAEVGFDALGIHADLDANGIRPIATSLVLKSHEIAAVAVSATLCRYKNQTRYVGGSHGVSIPLGHGFRYRVSSYRGQPVQSQFLGEVDKGTLVITNRRLVFLGDKRDISTPVAKLLHIEPFSNAIGIAREGKETRDIYLVPNPEYLLFFLEWIVSHQH